MSCKYDFIQKSLNCVEPWLEEHRKVMAAYDLADLLGQQSVMMAAVFDCLEMLTKGGDPNARIYSSDAVSQCEIWESWFDRATSLIGEIAAMEEEGFAIPQAERLRSTRSKASSWIDSLRKLSASLREVSDGQFHSMDEVLDELRD